MAEEDDDEDGGDNVNAVDNDEDYEDDWYNEGADDYDYEDDEEERQRLVMMAEQRLSLVEKEADRLESLDEYKARIFGTSKEELL